METKARLIGAFLERRQLDLPGFENLEGLPIGQFLA